MLRPAPVLIAAFRRLARAMRRRRGPGCLDRMDDRMLRDIGLTRQDVWSGAAEPLFRAHAIGGRGGAHAAVLPQRAPVDRSRAALRQLWNAEREVV